jgi:hypothetical protein
MSTRADDLEQMLAEAEIEQAEIDAVVGLDDEQPAGDLLDPLAELRRLPNDDQPQPAWRRAS